MDTGRHCLRSADGFPYSPCNDRHGRIADKVIAPLATRSWAAPQSLAPRRTRAETREGSSGCATFGDGSSVGMGRILPDKEFVELGDAIGKLADEVVEELGKRISM